MVICCPATTFVGKNTLMPSPRSADSVISSMVHEVNAPIMATDRNIPKYLNIFFIIEFI